ncbi:MAG: hypothetical protein R2684_04310 [Pyrinomonadaceae bacterium]
MFIRILEGSSDYPVEELQLPPSLEKFIGDDEWGALFIDTLHTPIWKWDSEIEPIEVAEERFMKGLREASIDYPLLGRFDDFYEDVRYGKDEIDQLLLECKAILAFATNPLARSLLERLIKYGTLAKDSEMDMLLFAD